jgi:hypothetical protein
MKSKLLQKISYGVSQSREAVDGQQENIEESSVPWTGHQTPPDRANRAVDAQACKGLRGLPKATTRFFNQRYL